MTIGPHPRPLFVEDMLEGRAAEVRLYDGKGNLLSGTHATTVAAYIRSLEPHVADNRNGEAWEDGAWL